MTSAVHSPNHLATSPDNPLAFHAPPRYDIHGRQIFHSSSQKELPAVKIPDNWKRENSIATLTELVHNRKKNAAPDSTYDLDGDGKVSPYEYFVSRLYDHDNDGKLTPQQRESAQKALGNGEMDKYTFGVEASGVLRSYRILQKRGVVIDSDDFSQIATTYPAFQSPDPLHKTRSELLETRKAKDVKTMKEKREKWIEENHVMTDCVYVTPDEYVQNPTFTSIHQKKALEKQQARDRVGLSTPSDIKMIRSPGTEFVPSPMHRSLSEMKTIRKANMLEELHRKTNFDHISREQRLMKRERDYIMIIPEGQEIKSWANIREEVRRKDNEENLKKFSNIAVGIHGGKELPKFHEHNQEYWKIGQDSDASRITSHRILNSEKKYWAPKCEYTLADVTSDAPQVASSKQIPLFKAKQIPELPEKPTNFVPNGAWKISEESEAFDQPQRKHHYRWSTLMNMFNQRSKSPKLPPVSDKYSNSKTESVRNKPNITLNSQENHHKSHASSGEASPNLLSKKPSTVNIMASRMSGMKQAPKTFLRSGGFSK
jgi:hypothetical protein